MQKYGSAFTAKITEVITNPFGEDVSKHFKGVSGKKISIENSVELQGECLHYMLVFFERWKKKILIKNKSKKISDRSRQVYYITSFDQ